MNSMEKQKIPSALNTIVEQIIERYKIVAKFAQRL